MRAAQLDDLALEGDHALGLAAGSVQLGAQAHGLGGELLGGVGVGLRPGELLLELGDPADRCLGLVQPRGQLDGAGRPGLGGDQLGLQLGDAPRHTSHRP